MNKRLLLGIIIIVCFTMLMLGCAGHEPALKKPIAGDFQLWADFNRNGVLDEDETYDLADAVMDLIAEPHDVETPPDELFDINRDGYIDHDEMERARDIIINVQLSRLYQFAPEMAEDIDLNDDHRIDMREIETINDFLFYNPRMRSPHRVESPLDEKMDWNEDGFIDEEEIEENIYEIVWMVSLLPIEFQNREEHINTASRSYLDELADTNGDGVVDPEERRIMREALREPHRVISEFDRRIDFNDNEKVEPFEIQRAIRADEIRNQRLQENREGTYPVLTASDALFDLNEDDHIDEQEISVIVAFLAGQEADQGELEKLTEVFDINRDSKVDDEEFHLAMEMYVRPHPSEPHYKLDKRLDRNNDGFISPEEIGIAAGITEIGPIPSFEERMERIVWEVERSSEGYDEGIVSRESVTEHEFQQKISQVYDKKVAVVGLKTATKNVSDETADGIAVFVENAFVNLGQVKVIDRQNITNIVKEYEFQQSDLTDETTAVKIGKLSGADIIVIGSISYVGEMFYLNIKLISVETAEILGSSIAEAAGESEFLDMCNRAVYKLF